MNSPFKLQIDFAIESMHSLSNVKCVGIFKYIKVMAFMIKRNQSSQ